MGFFSLILAIFNKGFSYYDDNIYKNRDRQWEYDLLEESPFLYSSQYLGELYAEAQTLEQREAVAGHISYHKAYDVDSYKEIEQKFIDERWKK